MLERVLCGQNLQQPVDGEQQWYIRCGQAKRREHEQHGYEGGAGDGRCPYTCQRRRQAEKTNTISLQIIGPGGQHSSICSEGSKYSHYKHWSLPFFCLFFFCYDFEGVAIVWYYIWKLRFGL